CIHGIRFGRLVTILGNTMIRTLSNIAAPINGMEAYTTWDMRVPRGDTPSITNKDMPNGGLARPNSIINRNRIPNHMGSKQSCSINGKNTGTVSIMIDTDSMSVPSIKSTNIMASTITIDGT